MIVTVVAMPEVTVTRTDVSQARARLAEAPFLVVDIELPEGEPAPETPIADQLGLDTGELDWFGREGEPTRAEFLGDRAGLVVPVVHEDGIDHVHAVVTERFLVTVHRGHVGLADNLTAAFRHERPDDIVAALFLVLQEALETFRRAAVRALLETEELEDDMFEDRQPEQAHRLTLLRRRSAVMHHALLPYLQVVDGILTRRMMSPTFPEARQRAAQGFQHAGRLVLADIESLQDATRRAFASYSSLVAGEQNGVINRLAIVSVIFLPLTFITGFFGMNFDFLTNKLDTRDEFWLLAVGLQVVVLGASLYVLHRTKVWRSLRDSD
ncbi:CorA family divalent cation transporter [Streptomyces sp. NPDC052301]|uniref:CorA family divalent cation transporter n=1 Tax=Streptomyces sp. NPDC052301 TaxID=3365687 RepID=UPI0037D1B9C8